MNIENLTPAAKAGDVSACNQVGDFYYNNGKIAEAMEYYKIAAKSNDANALYNLGYCYIYEDYNKDPSLGSLYLNRAADLGHAKACKLIGFFYFYGQQTLPRDDNKSFYYMKKGADLGDPAAQAHVGQCYEDGIWGAEEENHVLARHYYDLSLAQNYHHAQWCVGSNYKIGKCGYPQSYEKAFHYFKLAADNDSPKGQLDVAICYWNGQGTPQNHREAMKYMEKAAEQGNVEAMSRFGSALFFGIECEVTDTNLSRGRAFLKKAAEQGDKEALETLAEIAEQEQLHGPITAAKIKGSQKSNSSGGGCYVATAVYGSYDCPEVWTLRRYRDFTLAETWYGRAFIRTYYTISPIFVKYFGKTTWFRNLWKPALDQMVKNLNKNGVSDTPYDDQPW